MPLFIQPSKVTATIIVYWSFLRSISGMYTWQIPSCTSAEQIILSQPSPIAHCFTAKLLNRSLLHRRHCSTADLLLNHSHPLSLFLVRVSSSSSSSCVGGSVIFSQAGTWCQHEWSHNAVSYCYSTSTTLSLEQMAPLSNISIITLISQHSFLPHFEALDKQ